jgi:hypothetical protein
MPRIYVPIVRMVEDSTRLGPRSPVPALFISNFVHSSAQNSTIKCYKYKHIIRKKKINLKRRMFQAVFMLLVSL